MTRRAHLSLSLSGDGIDIALLLRVQVFCLIDTRAAHDDQKEARRCLLSSKAQEKKRLLHAKKEKSISSFI
jgi:hypothetical protein